MRLRLETLLVRRLAPAAVCALAIGACGSQHKPPVTTSTTATPSPANRETVDIYSSLPDSGAEAASSHQIEAGIELALKLAHHTAGPLFKVRYQHLCDTARATHRVRTPTSRDKISSAARNASHRCTGNWNATVAANNAATAARNPQTVAYIGDLNSGATELSLPILNQAGIVQISPGSGYAGLTNTVTVKVPKDLGPITQPGEPGRYYPQGLAHRTFLRMIPSDLVQASAALDVLHRAGCQKFSAWTFGSDKESKSLFYAVIATALKYKMDYVQAPALPAKTSDYETYAQRLSSPTGIRCAVLVGHVTAAAEALTLELREKLSPAPMVVGTSGFCTRDWAQGIPSVYRHVVAAELYCTTPARRVDSYANSAKFVALFRSNNHTQPTAYDLYGYAAAEMLLRALADSVSDADVRQQVMINMVQDFAPNEIEDTPGQVHAFSFDNSGNLLDEDNYYGVEGFKQGTPRNVGTVTVKPSHLLSSG